MKLACQIGVFARPPRPGAVKTRLVPALGEEEAARLYGAFLEDVLRTCTRSGLPTTLWVAGDPKAPDLLEIPGASFVRRRPQVAGDLGVRIAAALGQGLEDADRVLVVGSDVPTLPVERLLRAAQALDQADLVLGPTADGGYCLVGARGRVPPVFDGVRWSSGQVLEQTLALARRAGLRVRRLAPWYDVDVPADLALLRTHLRLAPRSAPATARALWLRG